MTFRFAFVGSSQFACEADNVGDIKALIECWHLPRTISYRLDEDGEGPVYWNGEHLGQVYRP